MQKELRQMFEVKETEMTVPAALSPELRNRIGRQRMVTGGLVAAAAVALVLGGFAGARSLSSKDAAPLPPADRTGPRVEQDPEIEQESLTRHVAVITRMADAVNGRNTDAFIDTFAHDGEFNPPVGGVAPPPDSVPTDGQPVADAESVRVWMAINEAWDLEVEVVACGEMTGSIRRSSDETDVFVECEVRARWHKLSLEVLEGWNFEFAGTELFRWGLSKPMTLTDIIDLNPPNRSLPLGYDGLLAWEEWLEANHPEAAARYLNPRAEGPPPDCISGCQKAWDNAGELAPLLLFGPEKEPWSINSHEFFPSGYIPYDPAYADEIQVWIQNYVEYVGEDTTENEEVVAEPSSILDGQVTYAAPSDWIEISAVPELGYLQSQGLGTGAYAHIEILPNSLPPDCDTSGGTPLSAEALVQAIRSDPDLEATAPVPALVGGVDALRLDVAAAPGAATCGGNTVQIAPSPYSEGWGSLAPGDLGRLYVLDLPEPLRVPSGPGPAGPVRTLTILIMVGSLDGAPEGAFERAVASAAPILDSFEFHAE